MVKNIKISGDLEGRHAIITGSTSGIGLGIAQILAEQGCSITLNGLGDKQEIEEVRANLESESGVRVRYDDADMTEPQQIAKMVLNAHKAIGRLDILVNNAGIQHVAKIEDFADNSWDNVLAINLSSTFHTIKHSLPLMKQNGWGRVINIASAHGLVASANKAAYVAAKHGVVGLTKVVALETAEGVDDATHDNGNYDITVNAICPGWVLTELVKKQIEKIAEEQEISILDAELQLLSEKQPSKRFVKPAEIGELVSFLCSDVAGNITGSCYSIDGGWLAQ